MENFHGGHPVQNHQEQEVEVGPPGRGKQDVSEYPGEEKYTLHTISTVDLSPSKMTFFFSVTWNMMVRSVKPNLSRFKLGSYC